MAEVDRPLRSAALLTSAPQRDRAGLLRPDVLPVALVLLATAVLIVILKLTVAGPLTLHLSASLERRAIVLLTGLQVGCSTFTGSS